MGELSDMELILIALCFTKVDFSSDKSLKYVRIIPFLQRYQHQHTFLSFKSFLSGNEMNVLDLQFAVIW